MVFIRNKKTPSIVVFSLGGETETSVTKRIPNQVSAVIVEEHQTPIIIIQRTKRWVVVNAGIYRNSQLKV